MSNVLRLSACVLLTCALVACTKTEPTTPASSTDTAPAADDAHVALDMGKVKSWIEAQKNLAAATNADPSLDPAQNISEEDGPKYVARLEASPKMRAAIEAAGLSVRDYAYISETLIGAMMAQGAVEAGHLKTIPDGIDPAAVEFVKQHDSELQALLKQAGASDT